MQVHTERGLINVEAEYQSEEKAEMDGYSYAFYSKELEKKVKDFDVVNGHVLVKGDTLQLDQVL